MNLAAFLRIRRRRLAPGLLGISLLWNLTLVAAPYIIAHESPEDPSFRAAAAVYVLGSFLCHQRSDRSFHPWGVQLPVCARCCGLYAGASIGMCLWVATALSARRVAWLSALAACGSPRVWLALSALPLTATVLVERGGFAHPSGFVRALTALPLGAGVAWVVARTLDDDLDG